MTKITTACAVAAMGALLTFSDGCIYYESQDYPEAYGSLALQWSFEGMGCYRAGVADVSMVLEALDGLDRFEVVDACGQGGEVLQDLVPGRYRLRLEGRGYDGEILYYRALDLFVEGGSVIDLGVVELYATELPPPASGELMLDWSFVYPDDVPVLDCSYAGVDHVEVTLTDVYGDVVLSERLSCLDGPVSIWDLAPGDYAVDLSGFGVHLGRELELYRAQTFGVYIASDRVTEVGTVVLDRVEPNFGDFVLDWSFNGRNSCQAVGVEAVTLRIVRMQDMLLEDEITVWCDEGPQQRSTFLPGRYLVELEAYDLNQGYWYGVVEVPLRPGELLDLTVQGQLSR